MKKSILFCIVLSFVIVSCKKTETTDTIITASTSQANVGQTVIFQVTTNKNAVSWTVSPSTTAVKQFSITNQKTNSIIFSQPGVYLIGVRARDISYDSTRHQNIDSCWHNGGGDRGGCIHGKDSSSVSIKVL